MSGYMLEDGQVLHGIEPDGVDEALAVFRAYSRDEWRATKIHDAFARALVAYRAWQEREAAHERELQPTTPARKP